MKIEHYNSERFLITIKVINDSMIIYAQALPWSPKIKLISKDGDKKDFLRCIDKDFLKYVECDENKFIERINEVAKLAIEYPS